VAGDFAAFPPGPRQHHFLADGDAPLVLLAGGERRSHGLRPVHGRFERL
jgi:uncharacterized cupin superfamily protein